MSHISFSKIRNQSLIFTATFQSAIVLPMLSLLRIFIPVYGRDPVSSLRSTGDAVLRRHASMLHLLRKSA
jgi:hypothetical protein